MNTYLRVTLFTFLAVAVIACGKSSKVEKSKTTELKVRLEKLKKQKTDLDAEIRKLETEIAKVDPKSSNQVQKLVAADTIRIRDFSHYIDLQGKIDAEGMAYVAPSGPGGQVKAIFVKAGSKVSKGQMILKLDDAVARQAINAAQQQVGQLRARLTQAQTVYQRYQNLWNQNIGAEIQVINAKADVDALSAQLRAAQAQVSMAQEQANLSNVRAGISGMIDEMNVKVGEFFSPQTAAQPGMGIRIVNNNNLKIVTNVPENYVTRVKKGDKVQVVVPESGRAPYESVITMVGGSIDPVTRSFAAEAKLPSDPVLKPNQTATIKILDY
jgi:RND family efflux transporter MFP subunit